jgi:uncharacterized protein (TIGR02996 family)
VTATGADLLQVIDENPDDVDRWLAYADWLQQEDAPRGELISLDIALETAPAERRAELEARRVELVAARAPALLGETFAKVIAEGYGKIMWRRGFVDAVAYTGRQLAHRRAVGWLVGVICTQYPEPFTFLRTLELAGTDLASVAPLVRFKHLASLDISMTNVTDLAPLAELPRLRLLSLHDTAVAGSAIAELRAHLPELVVRDRSRR